VDVMPPLDGVGASDMIDIGQKYKNVFVGFLVQIRTLKFAFEIT
jgi:hypothetical protein